jgi:hypothetical protein
MLASLQIMKNVFRKEMEDTKSDPVGSPIGENEPPVPIGSDTQSSKPIGERAG